MKKSIVLISCAVCLQAFGNDNFELASPSGSIRTAVKCDSTLTWAVEVNGMGILSESPISITLADGRVWGHDVKVNKARKESISRTIASPLTHTSEMEDNYNGLLLEMKGGWKIEFRAYDDAVAYRFISSQNKPFQIKEELIELNFPENFTATVPYVRTGTDGDFQSQFFNSFENYYTTASLSGLNPDRLAFLPLAIDAGGGIKAVFTEN